MATLYELDADLQAMEDALLEAGGEITPEQEEEYDKLLDAREDKWRAYLAMIRNMEAQADAIKGEAARLAALAKPYANSADRLKQRLLESMIAAGEQKVETPIGRIRVQYGPAPVEPLVDPEDLPDALRRVDIRPDLMAMKMLLKDGVPFIDKYARFGERRPHVRIY